MGNLLDRHIATIESQTDHSLHKAFHLLCDEEIKHEQRLEIVRELKIRILLEIEIRNSKTP